MSWRAYLLNVDVPSNTYSVPHINCSYSLYALLWKSSVFREYTIYIYNYILRCSFFPINVNKFRLNSLVSLTRKENDLSGFIAKILKQRFQIVVTFFNWMRAKLIIRQSMWFWLPVVIVPLRKYRIKNILQKIFLRI